MSGQHRALFLLAVTFWQLLTMLGSLSVVQHVREEGHQAPTEVHAFYQHHLDQSVHKNGETDAGSHIHAGSVTDTGAVLSGDALKSPAPQSVFAFGQLVIAMQTPVLAGLLRPPQILR